jgi:hypothetical protein
MACYLEAVDIGV